ncbi:MAG: hypothetical protein AAF307_12565 [Pseudomonadota bacterium]
MDVILHLGAHRTATTTFQSYMRERARDLAAEGVGFWGPRRVRNTLSPGLFRTVFAEKGRNVARRAEGRIRLATHKAAKRYLHTLIVSDENLLDTPIRCFRHGKLYPGAGERTARLNAAFEGNLRRIVLVIRSQELWWASTAAMIVARGHAVPPRTKFDEVTKTARTWRDVIMDMACAAPDAEISVLPFEATMGQPHCVLGAALQQEMPRDSAARWLNRSADLHNLRGVVQEHGADPSVLPDDRGRWQPFTAAQAAKLREDYADDMHWLISGADGLATLTDDVRPFRAGKTPPVDARIKGHSDDQGHMAQHSSG